MPARIDDDPPGLPIVVTRAQALAAGLSPDQIRHRVRGGHWTRLGRGSYARCQDGADRTSHDGARRLHTHLCLAATVRHTGSTIAFGSGAVVLGLPLISGIPALGQLVVRPGGWTGVRDGIRYRAGSIGPQDLMSSSIPITTASRTVVDVARTHSLADALSCGDSAVRRGLTDVDSARSVLSSLGSVRGCRAAASALAQLDGRRESPLESWSWARFVEAGLPLPELQREFWDDAGLVGRVDFWWPDVRLVGEVDGRMKYATADDVYAEKRREDRLRALDLRVARWGAYDLGPGWARLRARLTTLLR